MVQIKRVEDIEAWKKARVLVKEIYQTTGEGKFAKDFSLKDQIRRASVSIVSNIVHPVKYVGQGLFHGARVSLDRRTVSSYSFCIWFTPWNI